VLNFKLLLAVCCIVEVVKGNGGILLRSFCSILITLKGLSLSIFPMTSLTSFSLDNFFFLLSTPQKSASNLVLPFLNLASIVQYSSGLKSRISFSRWIIKFNAIDCTRPAERPFFIFDHNNGEIE